MRRGKVQHYPPQASAPHDNDSSATPTLPRSATCSLAGTITERGRIVQCADDVSKFCVTAAAPSAVEIGPGLLFVPDKEGTALDFAVADLLSRGMYRGGTG